MKRPSIVTGLSCKCLYRLRLAFVLEGSLMIYKFLGAIHLFFARLAFLSIYSTAYSPLMSIYYLRPVLGIGYSRCLRLRVSVYVSVCMCVNSQGCPWDISSLIQNRITKFAPEVQNILVKMPIQSEWPWPSRSNLTSLKVEISLCTYFHH